MSDLIREEPPASADPRTGARQRWRERAEQLRAADGEWLRLPDAATGHRARNLAHRIRTGHLAAFRPPGTFEALTRTVDGQHRVYARHLPTRPDTEENR